MIVAEHPAASLDPSVRELLFLAVGEADLAPPSLTLLLAKQALKPLGV